MLTKQEYEEMAEKIYMFHTKRAPGIAIGVIMVDFARDLLGTTADKVNAVSETQACLSDVLQVMMGCTIGNRYLKVYKDLGRYALTLFDRGNGRGVRVFVDLEKIDAEKTPELHRFFHRKRDKSVQKGGLAREESGRKIIAEFDTVGREILGFQTVQVLKYGKPPMLPAHVCSECGESFLARDDDHLVCDACIGENMYYKELPHGVER